MHFEWLDWLHLGTFVVIAHLLGAVAAVHAVINTRTSQGAVAWAVSLVAMPYFTLIPYLFLGRSKFAGYIDARRLENEILRKSAHPAEWNFPDEAARLRGAAAGDPAEYLGHPTIRALTRLSGMPFLRGNSVRVLINGTATFDAIFKAIDAAKVYVIVQFFIVHDDELGMKLKDLLIKKAQQSVRVYFLYDSIGSFDLPRSYVNTLRAGGVLVCYVPTTVQLKDTCEELQRSSSFGEIESFETMLRFWQVKGMSVRPMHRMIAHSAFIIVSRRLSDTVVPLPPSPIEDERVVLDLRTVLPEEDAGLTTALGKLIRT